MSPMSRHRGMRSFGVIISVMSEHIKAGSAEHVFHIMGVVPGKYRSQFHELVIVEARLSEISFKECSRRSHMDTLSISVGIESFYAEITAAFFRWK